MECVESMDMWLLVLWDVSIDGNGVGPVRTDGGGGVRVRPRGEALYETLSLGTEDGNGGKEDRLTDEGD